MSRKSLVHPDAEARLRMLFEMHERARRRQSGTPAQPDEAPPVAAPDEPAGEGRPAERD